MFKNFLLITLRTMARQKLFTFINITGLAIGMAACILIMLFVRQEFNWDTNWKDSENIYRIETTIHYSHRAPWPLAGAYEPFRHIMEQTFPEIEETTRFLTIPITIKQESTIYRERAVMAMGNFVDFFGIENVDGAALTIDDANGIMIDETTAIKYFGTTQAVGETLLLPGLVEGGMAMRVVGVYRDIGEYSHLNPSILIPFRAQYFEGWRIYTEGWEYAIWRVYVKLAEGTNPAPIQAALPQLILDNMPERVGGTESGPNMTPVPHMVNIEDIHLHSPNSVANSEGADLTMLFSFVGVALLILAIAVVNFINLTMARTAYRTKEVAIRKVHGASGGQLVNQFLSEAIIMAMLALLVSLALVELALPYYGEFLSRIMELEILSDPTLIAGLLMLGVVAGLGAGSYHAVHFAKLRPGKVLHVHAAKDGGSSKLRNILVITQFTVAIGLMTMALVVRAQVMYASSIDLGFDSNELYIISGTNNNQSDAFKAELERSPGILSVGRSSDVPTEGSEDRIQMFPASEDGNSVVLDGLPIGPDFFKAYDIPIIAGRQLDKDIARDTARIRGENYASEANIIVNRMAVRHLGFDFPEQALGQTIRTDIGSNISNAYTIIGVAEDFHFDSARDVIRPGIYYVDETRQFDMAVRINPDMKDLGIAHLNETFANFFPDQTSGFRSMEIMVDRQYAGEDRLAGLLTVFTILAIIISSLGLYGLASFNAEQRAKEVGIRKVLGASSWQIVKLLLKQYSKPIVIAIAIAWPLAAYLLHTWLNQFAYRIDLSIWYFVITGVAACLIGWATISGNAVRVARRNPIKALQYE